MKGADGKQKKAQKKKPDRFNYRGRFHQFTEQEHGLFERRTLPQLWQTALGIRHTPTISTGEKKTKGNAH